MAKVRLWSAILLTGALFAALTASGQVKDPYKALGINKDADEATIKKAFKKLALKYHPDKNPKGQSRFIEIQQAYEILSDPDKRRQYDLGGGFGGAGGFGGGGGGGGGRRQYQGSPGDGHNQFHFQWNFGGDGGGGGGFGRRAEEADARFFRAYAQQQAAERAYERALPSNTSFLTTSNFRSLVMHDTRPWLLLVYTDTAEACREFAPTWEALWRAMGGGAGGASGGGGAGGRDDGAAAGMGRVHARYQRSLVNWINRGRGGGSASIQEAQLPVVVVVPRGCRDADCFVRYRGPMRLSALQDYVADHLLGLPAVTQLEPPSLPAFLAAASPYKVVVLVFGRGGGSGSMQLRLMAQRQGHMLTLARAHAQDSAAAAAWQAALGLSVPPASGTAIFLRGPGTSPRAVTLPGGKASELQEAIDKQGLLWQEIPPLRPATAEALGCLWGRAAAASGRPLMESCVVAVARPGPALEAARAKMAALGRYLAAPGAQRDPAVSAAATAYMTSKLRLVWLDAAAQRHLCAWLMAEPAAMRPGGPPPAGSGAKAAAAAAAQAAAAAKAPHLLRAVCGASPLDDPLAAARDAAATLAAAAGLPRLAAALAPPPAAALLVLRPGPDGSSWARGGFRQQHTSQARNTFWYAVNAGADLAEPGAPPGGAARGGGAWGNLAEVAAWVAAAHLAPERQLHGRTGFPPQPRPDDEPSAVQFLAGRVVELARAALSLLLTGRVGGGVPDGSSPGSGFGSAWAWLWGGGGGPTEVQLANAALAVLLVAAVHLAWRRGAARRGPSGAAHQPPAAGSDSEAEAEAEAEGEAAGERAPAPAREAVGRSRGRAATRTRAGAGGAGPSGHSFSYAEGTGNRRAQSPSWRGGRRGDASAGDVGDGGGANGNGKDGGGDGGGRGGGGGGDGAGGDPEGLRASDAGEKKAAAGRESTGGLGGAGSCSGSGGGGGGSDSHEGDGGSGGRGGGGEGEGRGGAGQGAGGGEAVSDEDGWVGVRRPNEG